jgi:hypothetical protein
VVIVRADAYIHRSSSLGAFAMNAPSVGKSFFDQFEEKAMLRIHGSCLTQRD